MEKFLTNFCYDCISEGRNLSGIVSSILVSNLYNTSFVFNWSKTLYHGLIWVDSTVIHVNQENERGEIIIVNVNDHSMRIFVSDDFGELIEGDLRHMIHNGIIDLTDLGDRWEGDCVNGEVCGWGSLFDEYNKLMYEGFMIDSMKVCYGTEYYPDINQVKYCGQLCVGLKHGVGVLLDRRDVIEFYGQWVDENSDPILTVRMSSNNIKLPLLHTYIQEIVIDNNCNDESISSFELTDWLFHLRRMVICDGCFMNVSKCVIDGLSELQSLQIGHYSFCVYQAKPYDSFTREFHLTNCSSLESVEIGQYTFIDYKECELKGLPSLKSIKIGDEEYSDCFRFASNAHFIDLPSLETIELGCYVFCYCQSVRFENLPLLQSIILHDAALGGDDRDDRRTIVEEPFNYKNTLSMKNLPLLTSFIGIGNGHFCSFGTLMIEHINKYCKVNFPGKDVFSHVYKKSIKDARSLSKYLRNEGEKSC